MEKNLFAEFEMGNILRNTHDIHTHKHNGKIRREEKTNKTTEYTW